MSPPARPLATVEALVRALVAAPPTHISALERVIGPLAFCSHPDDGMGDLFRPGLYGPPGERFSALVASLSLRYYWDCYHERPYALDDGRDRRDPGLACYWLSLQLGPRDRGARRAAVCEALGAAGPAAPLADSPYGPGVRYGAFYLFHDGRTLAWYDEPPEWAMPGADEPLRARWLGQLAALLAGGCDHAALVAFCEAPAAGSGVRPIGALNRDDYQLALEPGLDAVACAGALGLPAVLATSGDTHGQSWFLVVPGGPGDVHDFVEPRFGAWTVEALLDGWPRERDPQGVREARGPWPVYDLARCEPRTVQRLFVAPRRR